MSSSTQGALGILAGGGPAPGINAVIAAATIFSKLVSGVAGGLKLADIDR